MNYPNNRLIVNGVDLTAEFHMILVDGYTLTPPQPKTYTVDIPGGNGVLDLTESLFGDITYENRKQEFTFYVIDVKNFENLKTRVSNLLHGRSYDYQLTFDPGYTYHGRFTVTSYIHSMYQQGKVGCIKISIDADPYKMKESQVFKIDAIGGKIVYLESGRMRVRPTIETDCFVKVIYDGKLITLPKGTWTVNDLLLTNGINELYFNSFDIRNLTWGNLKSNGVTWGEFNKTPLYEWYKSNGDGTMVVKKWEHLSGQTWSSLTGQTWADLTYMAEVTKDVDNIYIKYEWGDL